MTGAGAKVNSLGLSSVGAKVKHPLLILYYAGNSRYKYVKKLLELEGRAARREVVVPLCMQGVRTLLHLTQWQEGLRHHPDKEFRVYSAGHFGWLQAGVRG